MLSRTTNLSLRLWAFVILLAATDTIRGAEIPFASPASVGGTIVDAADVALGDVDNDGDMDAVAASPGDGAIAWFDQVGAGQFVERVVSAAAPGAVAVELADVDGDGDLDVVAVSTADDSVRWYDNDGALPPSWTVRLIDASLTGASDVSAADIDGDCDVDVVATGPGDAETVWFENDGAMPPVWTRRTVLAGFAADHVITGDANRDGHPDCILADVQANPPQMARLLINDGATPPVWNEVIIDASAGGAAGLQLADFDNDGDMDLATAATLDGAAYWYENDGAETPAYTKWTISDTVAGASGMSVIDVDSDGDVDVIAGGDSGMAWFENDGASPPSWTTRSLPPGVTGATAVEAGSLLHDGQFDIVFASETGGPIGWYENRTIHGSASITEESIIDPEVIQADETHLADMDADGDLDLLSTSRNRGLVAWWENDGLGGGWDERIVDDTMDTAGGAWAGDIDGDGDLDVVSGDFREDKVYWYQNANGDALTWTRFEVDAIADGAESVQTGDLDCDGDLDIVSNSRNGDEVAWYENLDGVGGTWAEHVIDTDMNGPNYVDLADFDGDGDLDVVSASRDGANNDIVWWENDGAGGGWTDHQVGIIANLYASSVAVDMDNDGDQDVVASVFNTSDMLWFENSNGVGTAWITHIVDENYPFAIYANAADLDGDGDMDVFGAGHMQGEIAWWENLDGMGTQWRKENATIGFTIATFAAAGDLNGDGTVDLVGSAAVANQLRWWANRAGQCLLTTTDAAPAALRENTLAPMLRIDATHLGRDGDGDAEWSRIALLFEESEGHILTGAQAETVIDSVRIYADDGDNEFEPAADELAFLEHSLDLLNGEIEFDLPDDVDALAFGFNDAAAYFVVLELTGDAADQGIASLRLTHRGPSSQAEDRDYDLALTQAGPAIVASATRAIVDALAGDADGDGDVDLADHELLTLCLTGPVGGVIPGCESADADSDGDVDAQDFAAEQANLPN